MLTTLYIENIAVIEKTSIDFTRGLNVLTGETGAGKSIIIDAINAIMGQRTSKEIIRTGEASAFVSAVFEDVNPDAENKLRDLGFEPEDGVLILQRTLSASGKNSVKINGRPATVSMLRELAPSLINIHGQHESYELFSPETHIDYIDSYGGSEKLLADYAEEYRKYRILQKKLNEADTDDSARLREIDLLSFQSKELFDADVQIGEEEALDNEREALVNFEKIFSLLTRAKRLLDGDDGDGGCEAVDMAANAVQNAAEFNSAYEELGSSLTDIYYNLRDCSENEIGSLHVSQIYGAPLAPDLLSLAGDPVLLTTPEGSWETRSGDWQWNEGPAVVFHDGRYYLYYSVNAYWMSEYSVDVAVSDHVLGPYEKQDPCPLLGPVYENGTLTVSGPGHNSFVTIGDELFTAYHTHTYLQNPSGNRQLCLDRAGFHTDGTAFLSGPTLAPQLRPLKELGLVSHLPLAACTGDPDRKLSDGDLCIADPAYGLQDPESQEQARRITFGGNPQRFDVVICRYPGRGAQNFVKRVIGLPGDTVEIRDGILLVNGDRYEEPYVDDAFRVPGGSNGYAFGPYTVPEGEYFVMGDHRNNSNDSRAQGSISRDMIVGHVRSVISLSGIRGIE